MSPRGAGLALLASLALAGCGSVSASVVDLRRDAAAVCRHINHRFRGPTATANEAQDARFLTSGIGPLAAQLQQLRAIAPPRDVADVYHAGLAALGQELVGLRAAVTAIHQGQDPAMAYRALRRQLAPLENQVNDAWQALEIADCLQ